MLTGRKLGSPLGEVRLIAGARGLEFVGFAGQKGAPAELADDGESGVLDAAQAQLKEYFGGRRRRFDLPLAPRGTAFQKRVWAALIGIAWGRTSTYGALAGALASSARAVGSANGRNPLSIIVPCHRVVGADGSLTGYAGGLERKAWLLAHEGVPS